MTLLTAGDTFGESLEIERVLGRGGMGTVYLANDRLLDRRVAVKVLSEPHAQNPVAVERFKREARALAQLRSEHVARAYAMGSTVRSGEIRSATCWLAMEYVDGASLAEIIEAHRNHGALVPVHRALAILRQTALGLSAVHRSRLVHRDVKPCNVVIEEHTGRPVLVDFGLVGTDGEKAEFETLAGTASYMAPEQAGLGPSRGVLTTQSDVYALGCTAFELMTGRVPFAGGTSMEVVVKQALEAPPRISSIRPELAPLDDLIARMLAKDPRARFPSCDALVNAFDEALAHFDEHAATAPSAPPARTRSPLSKTTHDLRHGTRILVVDDDPAFRRLVVALLDDHFEGRVQLVEADSGETALRTAEQVGADIVLLDFDMPGLDGIETLTRLRRLSRAASSRVVVVSGRVQDADRWRFSVLGVSDFLAKPIAPELFVSTVARMVEA
jgi:serine/threonine-protein kinase